MAYNATVSRPGRDQLAGSDVTALLLKVFSGEVLSTFAANTVMRGLHTIRTITSGKAAQFIVTGAAKSRFHTAGESLLDATNLGNALGNEATMLPRLTSMLTRLPIPRRRFTSTSSWCHRPLLISLTKSLHTGMPGQATAVR